MRASQIFSYLSFATLLTSLSASAGAIGFDPSLKRNQLEAGSPCADGSCYNFDKDGGLSGLEAQVHKINIFDKNGKDPRVRQTYEGSGKKYASIGRVEVNQEVPWDRDGKRIMTSSLVGSGFMISPCLFLTNYHTVFGESKSPNSTDFSVTFKSTKQAIGKPLVWGPNDKTDRPADDWAIVQFESNKCIGLETGWMIPSDLSVEELRKKKLRIAGLPTDKSSDGSPDPLFMSNDVRIQKLGSKSLTGTYLIDGAGRPGTSGGPLFYDDENGVPSFVGVYSGSVTHSEKILKKYDDKFANVAIDALALLGRGENYDLILADLRRNGSPRNRVASR